ncbi:unnamed protein product [Bemisia tabaci]|uniref:Uncharacterized protein n=1 Tax=Bemisia tabaci TaxID=7038 RepID=A0A9P0A760_BEMTA|nr:unnamed protein product [Bemisia tabaci]
MSTSDEDPVIKEIPVYLSNALQDRLYVYQYPTKPCGDGYCTSDITKTFLSFLFRKYAFPKI